jgi:dihydrofolate reductase
MRKLIYAINTTIDGCIDHTKFRPDEETFDFFTHLVQSTGTFLYGRTTYELMVPYWPDVAKDPAEEGNPDYEFAQAFDAVEQIVVFSKSLESSEDERTKIVSTDLQDEVLKLKQEQGKDILTGGITLASQLAELGLIDEYHFVVHPIIIGEGRRLFDGINLQEKLQLKLAETTVFKSGAVILRYLKQ